MTYNLGNPSGKPLLAEMHDPHKDRLMRAYYINSDTEVQIHDGVDSWIITVGSCLHGMKLEERIAELHQGSLQIVHPRRRVVEDDAPIQRRTTTARRRVHVS